MVEDFFYGGPVFGCVGEHAAEQVLDVLHHDSRLGFPAGDLLVVAGEKLAVFPLNYESVDTVLLCGELERQLLEDHGEEHHSQGENIASACVVRLLCLENCVDLWRHVAPAGALQRAEEPWLLLAVEAFRETEVRQFELGHTTFLKNQHVFELQIPVHQIIIVKIGHSLGQLAEKESYLGGLQFPRLDELQKTAMFSLRENHYVSVQAQKRLVGFETQRLHYIGTVQTQQQLGLLEQMLCLFDKCYINCFQNQIQLPSKVLASEYLGIRASLHQFEPVNCYAHNNKQTKYVLFPRLHTPVLWLQQLQIINSEHFPRLFSFIKFFSVIAFQKQKRIILLLVVIFFKKGRDNRNIKKYYHRASLGLFSAQIKSPSFWQQMFCFQIVLVTQRSMNSFERISLRKFRFFASLIGDSILQNQDFKFCFMKDLLREFWHYFLKEPIIHLFIGDLISDQTRTQPNFLHSRFEFMFKRWFNNCEETELFTLKSPHIKKIPRFSYNLLLFLNLKN